LMNEVFRHGDYVNVDVAKTGDDSSLHITVIKAMKVIHEQGLYRCSIMTCDNACMLIVYQRISSPALQKNKQHVTSFKSS